MGAALIAPGILHRFSISSSATGFRRSVLVHVYADKADVVRSAQNYGMAVDSAGAITNSFGYRHPAPEHMRHMAVIRLAESQLDSNTLAHEVTHAALHIYFADCCKWESRARAHIDGANEELAYLVGDLTGSLHFELRKRGYFISSDSY
ncbi:SprT-like domain-containing protein [Arthrobacter sp. ISL-95]|uniref:SprT-like domain-containing protein n=1 Tax=Arthrobacter sp. ISL-95 TaxID=2819116 RepID=UPI001BED2F54|nr:SprT-like domain-containing protein [Arthrobacter sp. ISL-95]MBT2587934.1 hypothetical protein [Arthrobacter sp. ISL-95]